MDGRPAGTWGDVGALSFGGSKLVTAGRGGALLLREAPLFQRAKTHLHRGLQHWAPLSEVQAAALRPQVRKLRDAHIRTAFSKREYFDKVVALRDKYPVLALVADEWVRP